VGARANSPASIFAGRSVAVISGRGVNKSDMAGDDVTPVADEEYALPLISLLFCTLHARTLASGKSGIGIAIACFPLNARGRHQTRGRSTWRHARRIASARGISLRAAHRAPPPRINNVVRRACTARFYLRAFARFCVAGHIARGGRMVIGGGRTDAVRRAVRLRARASYRAWALRCVIAQTGKA